MDKITFKQHLELASKALVDFSKQQCFNDFSNNYKYKISPDTIGFQDIDEKTEVYGDLTEQEIWVLKKSEEVRNQLLIIDQVIDLFNCNNKVPVWIDMSIYEAQKDMTVIELLCSERLRDDNELYKNGDITPFHLKVAIPPEHLNTVQNERFDVNWRMIRDNFEH